MAQINIKPNRIKFIEALEKRAKQLLDDSKKYKEAMKQYELDLQTWYDSADLSPSNIKKVKIEERYPKNNYVVLELKKYPTGKPKQPEAQVSGYWVDNAVRDIEQVVNLLKLSDEETVSSSLANRVASYL